MFRNSLLLAFVLCFACVGVAHAGPLGFGGTANLRAQERTDRLAIKASAGLVVPQRLMVPRQRVRLAPVVVAPQALYVPPAAFIAPQAYYAPAPITQGLSLQFQSGYAPAPLTQGYSLQLQGSGGGCGAFLIR